MFAIRSTETGRAFTPTADDAGMRRLGRPAALRWLGLAGAVLMAASAYLAGSPADRDAGWLAGVALWLLGAGGLAAAWWRLRVGACPRWLLATGALWAAPLLLAPPLGSGDVFAYACQGELSAAGLDPYVAGPDALPCRWLSTVPEPWRGAPSAYGPLWLLVQRGAAVLANGSLPVAVTVLRLVAVAGVLVAVAAGTRLARSTGGDPVRMAWLAIAPLTLVHAVSGAHSDALLAGGLVAALAVAAGGWPLAARLSGAGVVIGLAAAVKATALVVAPFAVVAVLPAGVAWRRFGRAAALLGGAAVGTLAALTTAGGGLGVLRGWAASADMVQWSSVPTGGGMAAGYLLRLAGAGSAFADAVATARLAGLGALAVVLLALLVHARRGGPAAAVPCAGVALLAVALLGPVCYPWYALAGVAVLAAGRLPSRAAAALGVAAGGLVFLILPDGLGLASKTKPAGATLDVLLVVYLVVRWLRSRRFDTRRRPPPGVHAASPPRT